MCVRERGGEGVRGHKTDKLGGGAGRHDSPQA